MNFERDAVIMAFLVMCAALADLDCRSRGDWYYGPASNIPASQSLRDHPSRDSGPRPVHRRPTPYQSAVDGATALRVQS